MVWLLFIVLSFATGLLRLPRWTILPWPVASVALGVYAVATEPTNYDMHGFGYFVGAGIAAGPVIAWLLDRAVPRSLSISTEAVQIVSEA